MVELAKSVWIVNHENSQQMGKKTEKALSKKSVFGGLTVICFPAISDKHKKKTQTKIQKTHLLIQYAYCVVHDDAIASNVDKVIFTVPFHLVYPFIYVLLHYVLIKRTFRLKINFI